MSKSAVKIDSRAKGSTGEREFSRLVLDLTGVRLERKFDQTRGGGHDLEPVGDCPTAQALRRFAIECKRYARVTPALLAKFWQQAEAQAQERIVPAEGGGGAENGQSKLLEANHGERLDIGAQGAAGEFKPAMEAMGAFDRPED